jgi:hypothetical protein
MPNGEEQKQLEYLIEYMPRLRNKPYLVFDVRKNCGGSSSWGKHIADALFGSEHAQQKRAHFLGNQYIEWRASNDNTTYLEDTVTTYINAAHGQDSKEAAWVKEIAMGMRAACNAGEPYYKGVSNPYALPDITAQHASLCTSVIFVIIDNSCVSACLDFIDEITLLGKSVILVGQQTMADSMYMELRSVSLPSNKGKLNFPIKVYRNRPRGYNEPYKPDIAYIHDMSDTKAMQQFVLNIIKGQ